MKNTNSDSRTIRFCSTSKSIAGCGIYFSCLWNLNPVPPPPVCLAIALLSGQYTKNISLLENTQRSCTISVSIFCLNFMKTVKLCHSWQFPWYSWLSESESLPSFFFPFCPGTSSVGSQAFFISMASVASWARNKSTTSWRATSVIRSQLRTNTSVCQTEKNIYVNNTHTLQKCK